MKAHTKPTLEQLLKTPFYVVSDTDNTLTWKSVNGVKINWSLNEDLTDAHELPADTTTQVPMQAGKKLYLFCTEDQPAFFCFNEQSYSDEACGIDCYYGFSAGGNVCFLSESSCYKRLEFQPSCRNNDQLHSLFSSSKLADVSNMIIGFSSVTDGCFHSMFYTCKSLKNAPVLLATSLPAVYVCTSMFYGCTSLAIAPELPATNVGEGCYNCMFGYCTSLAIAPELPATNLGAGCYTNMFEYCTSLVNEIYLPATNPVYMCYVGMFEQCSKITDLHFPKSLETDSTFLKMDDAPKFGATNATVHYDL